MLGIVGIKDTLKDVVSEAIKNCKISGISVIMATRDCIVTACAITEESIIIDKFQSEILKNELIATEPPNEKNLLSRRPYGRKEYIVNKTMRNYIIGQSFVELGLMLFLYLYAPQFIRESGLAIIAEADLIKLCFGKYPGVAPDGNG